MTDPRGIGPAAGFADGDVLMSDCIGRKTSRQTNSLAACAGLAALVLACGAAGAASAHSGTPGIIGPDPSLPTMPIGDLVSATGFDVAVIGHIPSRCQLGEGREINFGDITVPKQAVAHLGLECNVPFDLSIRARNGGLSHATMPNGQGGFSGTLSYGLSIDVPVLDPNKRLVSGRYEGRDLRNGVTLSSDQGIAKGGAYLKFQTGVSEGHGLLAGDYSEVIVLTIAPRM